MTAEPPLCVDLDGTLVATDTGQEAFLLALQRHPLRLLAALAALRRGLGPFKRALGALAVPDPARLPYREDVLRFLHEQRDAGRRLVLATASDVATARAVAGHLSLFDEVLATDGAKNLKGRRKAEVLAGLADGAFDYVGDAPADLPVWAAARRAYVVAPSPALLRRMERPPERVFVAPRAGVADLAAALRPGQWAKNLLVIVPLFTAHRLHEPPLLLAALLGALAFCAAASAGYVCNDLLDLAADREHPDKRGRPFASGRLRPLTGAALAGALVLLAALLAARLPAPFGAMLAGYLGLSLAYSIYVKRKLLLDVVLLAGLYTLRILAGGAAIGLVVSHWLLVFSMFLFLSLAFAKRYGELQRVLRLRRPAPEGRGYHVGDMDIVLASGAAAGVLAVLVFSLYLESPEVLRLYRRSEPLWLVTPALLYWILRVWFLARRGELPGDPVAFAVRDRSSWIAGLLVLGAVLAAWL